VSLTSTKTTHNKLLTSSFCRESPELVTVISCNHTLTPTVGVFLAEYPLNTVVRIHLLVIIHLNGLLS
jgi:hypothetical protein